MMSMSHVKSLTSPAYAKPADDPHGASLEYCFNTKPMGAMLPNDRSLNSHTDQKEDIKHIWVVSERDVVTHGKALESSGENADVVFGLLGAEPLSSSTVKMLIQAICQRCVLKICFD